MVVLGRLEGGFSSEVSVYFSSGYRISWFFLNGVIFTSLRFSKFLKRDEIADEVVVRLFKSLGSSVKPLKRGKVPNSRRLFFWLEMRNKTQGSQKHASKIHF